MQIWEHFLNLWSVTVSHNSPCHWGRCNVWISAHEQWRNCCNYVAFLKYFLKKIFCKLKDINSYHFPLLLSRSYCCCKIFALLVRLHQLKHQPQPGCVPLNWVRPPQFPHLLSVSFPWKRLFHGKRSGRATTPLKTKCLPDTLAGNGKNRTSVKAASQWLN